MQYISHIFCYFLTQDTLELIKLFAGLGDVNVRDNFGSTALHFAAIRGNEVAAAALLAIKDVDVNVGKPIYLLLNIVTAVFVSFSVDDLSYS